MILVNLGKSLLGGIGAWWLLLGAFYELQRTSPKVGFWTFLIIGLLLGGIWFVIDGLCVTGFLKRSIVITSNAIDAPITVMFGDLLNSTIPPATTAPTAPPNTSRAF